jgi:hypothetical protein
MAIYMLSRKNVVRGRTNSLEAERAGLRHRSTNFVTSHLATPTSFHSHRYLVRTLAHGAMLEDNEISWRCSPTANELRQIGEQCIIELQRTSNFNAPDPLTSIARYTAPNQLIANIYD